MDNVTHALAGLLIAESAVTLAERRGRAAPTAGFRRVAAIVGVVAAELPDADLLYAGPMLGMGRLGYLLHHRGHTHTVLFALLGALLVWVVAVAARRTAPSGWTAGERAALLGVALAGTLSHIALDYTNGYGVHPFWPVDDRWRYGDAIFIVEPWLWIAAIPPLLLLARSRLGRALLAAALLLILGAAWRIDLVSRGVALALTIGALAWLATLVRASRSARVLAALAAWMTIEATFFAASAAAASAVRAAVRAAAPQARLLDHALSPAIGDPLCFETLAVEVEGPTYRVSHAAVAPFPALRTADRCGAVRTSLERPSPRRSDARLRWLGEWTAPRAELASLAASNCVVAAALRFHRVPAWTIRPDGSAHLSDLRYGDAGFATIDAPARPATCPRRVPPWIPPRAELLGAE